MKQSQQLNWFLCLALLASSLMAIPAFAQEATEVKDETDSLKITGLLKLRGHYDFINEKDTTKQEREFYRISNAGIGFKKTLPWGEETIDFVVQTQLLAFKRGYRDREEKEKAPALKRIYLGHENFIMGKTDSNFCDPSALPATLLGDDLPSTVKGRVAQLSWRHQLTRGISYGIAAEEPLQGTSNDYFYLKFQKKKEKRKKESSDITRHPQPRNFPTVAFHVKYEHPFVGYVRLGGLLRIDESYNQEKAAEKELYKNFLGGINVTSTFKLIPDQLSVKLNFLFGRGLGEYLTASSFSSVAAIGDYKDDKPCLLNTRGLYGALECGWLPKLRSTFAVGNLEVTNCEAYNLPENKDKRSNMYKRRSDAYKKSFSFFANITYNPTARLVYGIEYMYNKLWMLEAAGNKSRHRIQAGVNFRF